MYIVSKHKANKKSTVLLLALEKKYAGGSCTTRVVLANYLNLRLSKSVFPSPVSSFL